MRLLDVANVVTGDVHFPSESDPRGCGVSVALEEVCTDGIVTGKDVVTGAEAVDTFTFRPFGITAALHRKVRCHREDDTAWLAGALADATEQALGAALVVEPYDGAESRIGNTAVAEAADLSAGRKLWLDSHVQQFHQTPILHVAPSALPALVNDDVVLVSDEGRKHYTVWGDPVVVNHGYEGFPSFWTGDILIRLSSVLSADQLFRDIRANALVLKVNRLAAVSIPPCAIVRNGAMP